MSIYGEGNVRSPHFLGPELSLIELWRQHRAILGQHDLDALVQNGQLVRNEHGVLVEPPKAGTVAAAKVAKPKKRGGRRK